VIFNCRIKGYFFNKQIKSRSEAGGGNITNNNVMFKKLFNTALQGFFWILPVLLIIFIANWLLLVHKN
jgi:predicted ABC-type sugar transport system permease subunit